MLSVPPGPHPLRVLSLPRPDVSYLWNLEAWLYLGLLPNMKEIYMRDTRWIRPGLTKDAGLAGVQGEMMEWNHRLTRWRIRILDANGKESAP